MKSKKVTMLAAALVVAVVAFAAVGYATQYTAKTTNANNDLESTYIVISQTDGATYETDLFAGIYFDTVNAWDATASAAVTEYTPVYTHYKSGTDTVTFSPTIPTDAQSGTKFALVSKDLTITIDKTNSGATNVEMNVVVDNFSEVTGLTYTMILGTKDSSSGVITQAKTGSYSFDGTKSKATWAFTGVPLSTDPIDYNVFLFISGDDVAEDENIDSAGFAVGGKSTFTFTVEAQSTNNDGA